MRTGRPALAGLGDKVALNEPNGGDFVAARQTKTQVVQLAAIAATRLREKCCADDRALRRVIIDDDA